MVTPKYLGERSEWAVSPCNKCGLRYLFDAPSDLIKVIFPNLPPGSDIKMFTSFCGLCGGGGVHLVSQGNIPPDIALKFKPNPEPESIVLPAVKTTDATSKPPPSKWWGILEVGYLILRIGAYGVAFNYDGQIGTAQSGVCECWNTWSGPKCRSPR